MQSDIFKLCYLLQNQVPRWLVMITTLFRIRIPEFLHLCNHSDRHRRSQSNWDRVLRRFCATIPFSVRNNIIVIQRLLPESYSSCIVIQNILLLRFLFF